MSNPYSAFDLAALETLRDRYVARGDGARAAQVREAITATGSKQTDELYNSGRIFAVERPRDATGRVIVEHEKRRRLSEKIGNLTRVREVAQGDGVLSFYEPREPAA